MFRGKLYSRKLKQLLLSAVFSGALLVPVSSQAIELENPNMCSSGITNMMSDMGLMAYKMADFMNGFCRSIPFFGSFCPDLDGMAGSFFSKVLENPDLTLDMLSCADSNPSMLDFMLHVMDENPSLLTQMGTYLGQTGDGSSKGCQLGELFTGMATRHTNLKDFFFAKLDNHLYQNFGENVLCKSDALLNLSVLVKNNPAQALAEGAAFDTVFRNIGSVDDNNDGNEHTNEQIMYAMFSNVDAALNFMQGIGQLEPADQQRLMDFLFLSKLVKPGKTCSRYDWRCTPTDPVEEVHTDQAYYNMYAVIQALSNGVIPNYVMDAEHPPVPDSDVPANALFGQFMPLMLTDDYQINSYGMSFFGALISAYLTHQHEPASDVTMHMMGLVNLQQVPFTMADLGNLMSQLNNPDAPQPRLFVSATDTSDSADNSADTTNNDGASADPVVIPPVVTTKEEVFSGKLNWYDSKDFGPFKVTEGSISVKVTGSGDVNLFVRRGGSNYYRYRYDCISDQYRTSNESCELSGAGSYYIMLDGNGSAYSSNYEMNVTYQ